MKGFHSFFQKIIILHLVEGEGGAYQSRATARAPALVSSAQESKAMLQNSSTRALRLSGVHMTLQG